MKISQTVFNLQSGQEYMVEMAMFNVQCSKGNNSKSRQTRVMVHKFCTPCHSALHLCDVS